MNRNKKDSPPADWPSSILVVDDDPIILKFLGELLGTLGITATLAGDGQEAMEKLKSKRFPLVLTDMNMPHIDGMQLIAHIRAHYPETDIIAMTGYSKDHDLVDVIRAGAADYLTKPFTVDELKARIKRVTRERTSLQHLQQEIAKRHRSEITLDRQKKTLMEQVQHQKNELLEVNTALRIMLRQRDMEKNELQRSVATRFFKEIAPYLEKLQQTQLQEAQKHYLDIVTMNLENIFFPASPDRTFTHKPFTETEARVVNLIKLQKSSKEIAALLHVSTGTIRTHRENIRKKLQITNTKKNLYKTILSIL